MNTNFNEIYDEIQDLNIMLDTVIQQKASNKELGKETIVDIKKYPNVKINIGVRTRCRNYARYL